jgi:hemimethylated DNA binding protein
MIKTRTAKFQIGQVVKHRIYPFRGVVFDIDPVFDNTARARISRSIISAPRTRRRNTSPMYWIKKI